MFKNNDEFYAWIENLMYLLEAEEQLQWVESFYTALCGSTAGEVFGALRLVLIDFREY
jgi:hypothetical protein